MLQMTLHDPDPEARAPEVTTDLPVTDPRSLCNSPNPNLKKPPQSPEAGYGQEPTFDDCQERYC